MKTIQTLGKCLIACSLALAATIPASTAYAQALKDGTAVVKHVTGSVQYSSADGTWTALTAGTVLPVGSSVKTASASYADLSLNERASVVRVAPESTLKIDKLAFVGGLDGDSETRLSIEQGTVLGSVKKLSKASHFEVKTPNGVAGIRGTDFAVTALLNVNGNQVQVTFTCVEGELVASAMVPGNPNPVTVVLTTGQSWTPGGNVVMTAEAILIELRDQLSKLIPPFVPVRPPSGNPGDPVPTPSPIHGK